MKELVELVRPRPDARTVAFYSFGEALYGGPYYDTQSLENVLKDQCLLASQMNGKRLEQVYGAPLRLCVENQLGYKMVKWIERIEFVESENCSARERAERMKMTSILIFCRISDARVSSASTGKDTDQNFQLHPLEPPGRTSYSRLDRRLWDGHP
jgi:DMSO/TMAO reductase YedYZ molybdopterin-dependent catalytic subunit